MRRKPPVKVLAMRDKPLAFFLTWSCYGCWLPGDDRGYVDREHNQYGRPRLEPRPRLAEFVLKNLADPPFALSNRAREMVAQAIRDHCLRRDWFLFAQNVRTTHVHVVVEARDHGPEVVLDQFKAWATRRLREAGVLNPAHRAWTRHGSTIYVFDEATLKSKIDYVLNAQ
ncbi:MAG TPA: hypothetical protein VHN77_01820 [Phycisphaerales bacterium]|nr:hypothetical protein [Phycisphaerales bacterium]